MKVHEYQAKLLFREQGLSVPEGSVAATAAEARDAVSNLGGRAVLKAQVHAGGRAKGGGIRIVSSPEEAEREASAMLGSRLVTPQTGPEGAPVRRLLVEETVEIERELYASAVVDGSTGCVTLVASEAGGVDIEQVAEETPERIVRVPVPPAIGFQPCHGRKLAYGLGLGANLVRPLGTLAGRMYDLFTRYDCSLVEINPLAICSDGRLLALDAKVAFDDYALFRHPELAELADPEQDDPFEARAREHDLSYVKLDGEVGCIVNGAGLAMATMDVATEAGTAPANFLDIGGAADEAKIAEALKIVLSDPGVTRVLVNIFGGILRNDIVAGGLLAGAAEASGAVPPMVVRMLGANAAEGVRMLQESDLDVTIVDDLRGATEALKVG